MVQVLVIADEIASNLSESTLHDLAPELVLSAGDLPWDYVEWVAATVDCPLVFVPGNHDPECGPGRSDCPAGTINADQQVVSAAGLTIAGLGGCVRYNSGPHQYTQRQYAARCSRLLRRAKRADQVDVLLTHAPPLDLGDGEDGPHRGIEGLHRVLAKLEPTWHLHGHIHPYGRRLPDRQVGPTTLRNVIPWTVLDITPKNARVAAPSR